MLRIDPDLTERMLGELSYMPPGAYGSVPARKPIVPTVPVLYYGICIPLQPLPGGFTGYPNPPQNVNGK